MGVGRFIALCERICIGFICMNLLISARLERMQHIFALAHRLSEEGDKNVGNISIVALCTRLLAIRSRYD